MSAKLTKKIENIWRDKNPVSIGLLPLSFLYRFLMFFRRVLFKAGIFKSYRTKCPVIIIGNISSGGNGKTPFTIWLVEWLTKQGFRPGVIIRGYKATATEWPIRIDTSLSAADVGDEAWLLSSRIDAPVVAGPDRYADCFKLLAETDCNIIISDDGLQHLALQRDFEIVLTSESGYSGNGFCLPAGPMREPLGRLKTVDLVVNTSGPQSDTRIMVRGFRNLHTKQMVDTSTTFTDKKVLALCGIANPDRFFYTLTEQGLQFDRHIFPDHHNFSSTDLSTEEYDIIIMTEKDAVKCADYANSKYWCVIIDLQPSVELINTLETTLLAKLQETK